MPQIGEIRPANTIGYKDNPNKMIFVECPGCGKKRWVQYNVKEQKPRNLTCNVGCYKILSEIQTHKSLSKTDWNKLVIA